MLGVAAATASPWLLLGGALANALAAFGYWRALAVYPMIFGLALVTAALAFALVTFLVGRAGPRIARTVAHTAALTVGVAIFALGQAPRFVAPGKMAGLWHSFMPDGADANSPLWLPGRAMLGERGPLLASLAACVLVFVLALVTLDNRFASGAISAAAFAPGRRPAAKPGQFKENAFAATMLKNLRLLTRFPGLVTQTVYRSLTLVPVAVILTGHTSIGVGKQVVVPLVVFLSGQLALFFCSVIIASDQAPDLLRAAPVPAGMNKRASGAASLYATMLIMALPIMGILLREPPNLAVTVSFALAACISNLALAQNFPIPLMRAEFGKSQKGSVMGLVIGVAVSSVWALAAYAIVTPEPFAFLHAGTAY
jgi:ABC-2 type transport system permease protein